MYKVLMILLTIFTLADTVVTRIGLSVGCVELNQFVTSVGLVFWFVFRIGLLGYMLATFGVGYRLVQSRFSRGVPILKASLFVLDIYMGAVVFSGIFSILARLAI
jgi:hypothetical protein